jgi:hypothetical protein
LSFLKWLIVFGSLHCSNRAERIEELLKLATARRHGDPQVSLYLTTGGETPDADALCQQICVCFFCVPEPCEHKVGLGIQNRDPISAQQTDQALPALTRLTDTPFSGRSSVHDCFCQPERDGRNRVWGGDGSKPFRNGFRSDRVANP